MRGKLVCSLIAGLMLVSQLSAQTQVPTSVDSTLVLDAAGAEQRKSLGSIYLIVCPETGAGTGFLLESGVVVTNAHVVGTCDDQKLFGLTAENHQIKFRKIITDTHRDLALLVPGSVMKGGLKLAGKDSPVPGTTVSTWGYPLLYNGASPLLSVGYVSGYRATRAGHGDDSLIHPR
jgi:S1-C subfamily serine protease